MSNGDHPPEGSTSKFASLRNWAKEWLEARALLATPIIVAVVIGRIYGEGLYLLLIVGALYALLFAYNSRRHANASMDSFREDQAVHIGCWAAMLAIVSLGMAFLMFAIGAWE